MNSDTALVVYAFINIFSIYCVHSLHTFMYVCRGALIIIFIHDSCIDIDVLRVCGGVLVEKIRDGGEEQY